MMSVDAVGGSAGFPRGCCLEPCDRGVKECAAHEGSCRGGKRAIARGSEPNPARFSRAQATTPKPLNLLSLISPAAKERKPGVERCRPRNLPLRRVCRSRECLPHPPPTRRCPLVSSPKSKSGSFIVMVLWTRVGSAGGCWGSSGAPPRTACTLPAAPPVARHPLTLC